MRRAGKISRGRWGAFLEEGVGDRVGGDVIGQENDGVAFERGAFGGGVEELSIQSRRRALVVEIEQVADIFRPDDERGFLSHVMNILRDRFDVGFLPAVEVGPVAPDF